MNLKSAQTAKVYIVTQLMTWNNSAAYCETTMSTAMNTECYLAEILTAAQRDALLQAAFGSKLKILISHAN
jgi:hypothetical protein